MTTPLWKQWKVTRVHLEAARDMLPDHLIENDGKNPELEIGTTTSYIEFLEHNELELALDQLEALGRLNEVSGEFWKTLSKAAVMMKLNDRLSDYDVEVEVALAKQRPDCGGATGH